MGQSTMTPNAAARTISATVKRPVTPKAVRTMARSVLARFDKSAHPEYQSHAYTSAEVATLRKAFETRGARSAAQPRRKASAVKSKSAPKRTVRKASAPTAGPTDA